MPGRRASSSSSSSSRRRTTTTNGQGQQARRTQRIGCPQCMVLEATGSRSVSTATRTLKSLPSSRKVSSSCRPEVSEGAAAGRVGGRRAAATEHGRAAATTADRRQSPAHGGGSPGQRDGHRLGHGRDGARRGAACVAVARVGDRGFSLRRPARGSFTHRPWRDWACMAPLTPQSGSLTTNTAASCAQHRATTAAAE